MVRLVRNLSRVADHGLAPYHSVNNGRIHKSPQIDLLHPLNLVVCVDNEVFYLFGRFWSRSWPFREVSFAAVCSPTLYICAGKGTMGRLPWLPRTRPGDGFKIPPD